MKNFSRPVLSAFFLILLASALGVLTSNPAWAAGPPPLNVDVVNPPSSPVPVAIQGTGTVSGSVAITNTPDVNINNAPNVHNADNPAFQPVSLSFSQSTGAASSGVYAVDAPNIFTVPTGKRLVIEFVSTEVTISAPNSGSVIVSVATSGSTNGATHFVGASSETFQCTVSQVCFVVGKSVRIYANPGDRISVGGRVSIDQGVFQITVAGSMSGYLVNLP